MASQIPNVFVKKWSDDVTHLASQKRSKLLEVTTVARDVVGSEYNFPTFAGMTATARAAGSTAVITAQDPLAAFRPATLADFESSAYAARFDDLKTNINQQKAYQEQALRALYRQLDDSIIAVLNTGAGSTLPTVTGGLTFAKLQEAITSFNEKDVDEENRVFVTSPKALTEALGITQLTSADYTSVLAIQNAKIGSALGMQWVMSSRLPKVTTNRTLFTFNKDAVGVALGQDVKVDMNYIPERLSTLITTTMSVGAAVIDGLQVYKMTCVE